MYVLPSDGVDRELDTNEVIVKTVTNFQNWLSSQMNGRKFRVDTYQGSIDITFVRLNKTNEWMKGSGSGWPNGIAYLRDRIEAELSAMGLINNQKIYPVYYDGGSSYACGGASYPPSIPGRVTAMYLQAVPSIAEGGPYNANCTWYSINFNAPRYSYWDYAMVHEILHSLGFAPSNAPHHTSYSPGHVSDNQFDIMYTGSLYWGGPFPWDINTMRLDVGRDDYYQTGRSDLLELGSSPYLTN